MMIAFGHRLPTPFRVALRLAVVVLASVVTSESHAAPPKLNYLFPAGGQRGQSVTITANGEFSNWPPAAWVDRPGVAVTPDRDKGKLNVEIDKDAGPGIYWLRLYDGEGATQLKPLVVGTLAEVAEAETNDLPDKPQEVEPRVVINGKLAKQGDVDGYRLPLKQGQTLVASVQANSTLGSPMDSVLQVCELIERADATSQTRKTEAYVVTQNHDAIGLDPQLAFTAPRDGAYLVRLFAFPSTPDSSIRFAGAETFIYRLTLTTGGFIDHALPLALPHESWTVELGGWNLWDNMMNVSVPAANQSPEALRPPDGAIEWIGHADAAGAIPLPRVDHGHSMTALFNDVDRPQEVLLPITISGRLVSPNDVHAFAFDAAKDQKLRLRIAAKSLGYPTDATLTILDDAGKTLAEADDTGRDDRDPQLDFTPPAAGRYRVLVRDLARRGDVRLVYRLTLEPVRPDFSLSIAADSFVLEKGKPLEIPVSVTVRDGLREAIEIQAIGLPPGITAEPARFQPTGDAPAASSGSGRRGRKGGDPAPSGPSVKLILKGDPALFQPGGTPIRIEGRVGGDSPLVRTARFSTGLPLTGSHHAPWLTVRQP
jgi:hypothetical protein